MTTKPITFEDLPSAVGQLLKKLEDIERFIAAQSVPDKPSSEYVNADSAAEILHIKKSTLYNKISGKKIPYSKPGKHLLFLRSDLFAYLSKTRKASLSETQLAIEQEIEANLSESFTRKKRSRS